MNMEEKETHPFFNAVDFQKLANYASDTGTFVIPEDVMERGFIMDFGAFIQGAYPAWNLTPSSKDQMMMGLNNLFASRMRWAMPMFQPSSFDVLSTLREVNVYIGGTRVNEEDLSTLCAHEIAPNFRIPYYHGDTDSEFGDMDIGSRYYVLVRQKDIKAQNMLDGDMFDTCKEVYPSQVGVSSDVRKLFEQSGLASITACNKLIDNVLRLGPEGMFSVDLSVDFLARNTLICIFFVQVIQIQELSEVLPCVMT